MVRLKWHPPTVHDVLVRYEWGGMVGNVNVNYSHIIYYGLNGPPRNWVKQAQRRYNFANKVSRESRRAGLTSAFLKACDQFDKEMTKAIRAKVYPWPNRTKRKNKTTVFRPRDIVDLDNFRKSQKFRRVK